MRIEHHRDRSPGFVSKFEERKYGVHVEKAQHASAHEPDLIDDFPFLGE